MDWLNTKILDSERSHYKRLVSEMIYIKMQKNGLNKQSDTEHFPEIYLPFIIGSLSTLNISPSLFRFPSFPFII